MSLNNRESISKINIRLYRKRINKKSICEGIFSDREAAGRTLAAERALLGEERERGLIVGGMGGGLVARVVLNL